MGKRNPKRSRMLIGLTQFAGYCAALFRGFQKPGFDSGFFDLAAHRFNYGANQTSSRLVSLYRWLRIGRLGEVCSALSVTFTKRMPGGSGDLHSLARWDFVIDYLHPGLSLAGSATEAAFRGKTAVVAGITPNRSTMIFRRPGYHRATTPTQIKRSKPW